MRVTLRTNPTHKAWFFDGSLNSIRIAPKWVHDAVLDFPTFEGKPTKFRAHDYHSGLWSTGDCYVLSASGGFVSLVSIEDFRNQYRVIHANP